MENRFGFKDFLVITLLLCVIIVVGLAMFQIDRQYKRLVSIDSHLAAMTDQSAQQSRLLRDLTKQLASGLVVTGGTGSTTVPATTSSAAPLKDPFIYQKLAAEQPDYAEGDWLISNFGVKISKITPLLSSDVYASIMQNRVLEALAYRDPETFEWIPLLAASWTEPVDNRAAWQAYVDKRMKDPLTVEEVKQEKDFPPDEKSADREKYTADRMKQGRRESDVINEPACPPALSIRFQLRPNVVFSNGDPFTADDLVFTFQFIMNPKVDAPRQRTSVERIKAVTAISEHEVEFSFKEPFFESFSLAASFSPMSRKFYSKYSVKEFNESVGLLIGTGPYRMKDPSGWHPGDALEMVRNERYWGMPGPFDRLYWREVEEDAASLTLFRNGETDTFVATADQYDTLKNDQALLARAQPYEFYARDGGYSYVAWNQLRVGKPTRFADKRVRKAMTLLINRDRMSQDIFRGYAKPAPGPFGIASHQNDPAIKPWPYDSDRAMQLLAEAGYTKKDAQGVLLGPDGTPFKFRLCYGNKSPVTERMVLSIKDSMARVGIVLEQEPTDWPIMLKKIDTRDFDAITLGWSGGIETDIFQMFHSSQIEDGDNYMSYRNPELDKNIEIARRTLNEEERMKIWQKCHQILHEDQPYTFMLYRKNTMFVDKRIKNVSQTRSGLNYLSDDVMPIPWYVPAAQQKHKN